MNRALSCTSWTLRSPPVWYMLLRTSQLSITNSLWPSRTFSLDEVIYRRYHLTCSGSHEKIDLCNGFEVVGCLRSIIHHWSELKEIVAVILYLTYFWACGRRLYVFSITFLHLLYFNVLFYPSSSAFPFLPLFCDIFSEHFPSCSCVEPVCTHDLIFQDPLSFLVTHYFLEYTLYFDPNHLYHFVCCYWFVKICNSYIDVRDMALGALG